VWRVEEGERRGSIMMREDSNWNWNSYVTITIKH
jgi:hypothetical protein